MQSRCVNEPLTRECTVLRAEVKRLDKLLHDVQMENERLQSYTVTLQEKYRELWDKEYVLTQRNCTFAHEVKKEG